MAILIGISLIRSKLFRTVLDLATFRAKLKIFIRPNFISRLSGSRGQISGLIPTLNITNMRTATSIHSRKFR